jgi:signal transduction histidine kinase
MDGEILDSLVLCVICTAFYAPHLQSYYAVVPILVAITLLSANIYFKRTSLHLGLFAGYSLLCLFIPPFLLFLPLFAYGIAQKHRGILLIALLPGGIGFFVSRNNDGIFMLILLLLSMLMSYRSETLNRYKADYIRLRDTTKETSMHLTQKNKNLLEKQDYEIRVATLNERNRIARDIHDGVGHLLSSALLQVGALMATCRDAVMKEQLTAVKETLSKGMDNIRTSVHELYDESIDLQTELSKMIDKFSFCPVRFDCNLVSDTKREIKYTLIAVVGEALSNVTRHSDATQVTVSLQEHPTFYQLVVKDNGAVSKQTDHSGIGLANITDRVKGLNGILNITRSNGFKIFITLPKENSDI